MGFSGIYCAVSTCKNKHGDTSKFRHFLRLHKAPIEKPPLYKKWMTRIKRKPDKYKVNFHVCSDHFFDSDYENGPYLKSKLCYHNRMTIPLKPGSIPNTDPESGVRKEPYKQTSLRRKKRKRLDLAHIDQIIAENTKVIGGYTEIRPRGPEMVRQHLRDLSHFSMCSRFVINTADKLKQVLEGTEIASDISLEQLEETIIASNISLEQRKETEIASEQLEETTISSDASLEQLEETKISSENKSAIKSEQLLDEYENKVDVKQEQFFEESEIPFAVKQEYLLEENEIKPSVKLEQFEESECEF